MDWEQIRSRLPDQWLLVEALKAHSESGKRIVEDLSVVGVFPDSRVAMADYRRLHREYPDREMYVLHTSREQVDIEEIYWTGIRPAQ